MNIECVKEKLGEAITKAEKITAKNATLPILSGIFLDAKNGELSVKSTNLDLGIEIKVPVKVDQPGTIVVPGSILSSFLSGLPNVKNVALEAVEGNLKVVTQHNSTVIKTLNHDDFPTIPILSDQESKSFSLPSVDFVRGLKSVWYSGAASSIKPELSSIYIHTEGDSLIFTATDSFRLAEKKIRLKKALDIQFPLIFEAFLYHT